MAAAAEPPARCREVERKFKVPAEIEQRLDALGARFVSRKTFVDTYYDTEDGSLCLRDHWLRLRSGESNTSWELKYRRKGDTSCGSATAYREERGDHRIMTTLGEVLPRQLTRDVSRVSDLVANGTLGELAVIRTDRKTFRAPGNAVVDIDETDWGYSVGEVEVVLAESGEGLDQPGAIDRATAEIAELCVHLGIDEKGSPPEGKVENYLRIRRPELYRRLVECTIFPES
ncbi:hypothetical protein HPB50_027357 [Hyalomma asiaticum]|uniref:Uncharacterized protein n=1 Tax=Hyalomma asiaticum TaxID=266040 RepID=A0ACB7TEH4_HYAAI|nr:hypothetical protein HPB50_027357 [Hyalomma asiaticum]